MIGANYFGGFGIFLRSPESTEVIIDVAMDGKAGIFGGKYFVQNSSFGVRAFWSASSSLETVSEVNFLLVSS